MYGNLDAHMSIQGPEDFSRYAVKTRAVGEGRKCLEELMTVLSKERSSFEEYWNWVYSDLHRKVKALELAKQEVEALYVYFEEEIGKLVDNLTRPNDSPALKELLKTPAHIQQLSPCFFAFQPVLNACYMEGSYTSSAKLSVDDLVTGWQLQLCECADCCAVRKALCADSGQLRSLWREICAQNPDLPPYQAEEVAVRKHLRGFIDAAYLEPLRPGQKKKK